MKSKGALNNYPKSAPGRCRVAPGSWSGFTLIELLAVLAVCAGLVSVVAPALGRTRSRSQSFQCMKNLRQLMHAMTLYAHDYHELLPPNPDDGNITPGYMWCGGQAGIGGADEFNPDLLQDPKRSLLAPYLNYESRIFHCTADWRVGLYDGASLYPDSPLKGTKVPAARSLSMSQAVGTIDPFFSAGGAGHGGVPNLPVNGPWLTGVHGANSAARGPWRTYGKFSQMVAPTPSQLWVVIEENPYSVNDAGLASSVGLQVWIDYPSTLHDFGCALAFADGHAELHRWVNTTTGLEGPARQITLSGDTSDWSWLAARTSAKR